MPIREAIVEDLPRLNAIMFGSRAYAGDYGRILEGYDLTPDYLARHRVFVEETQGRLAGFYSLALTPVAELDLLFTADEHQGAGVGARLFAHMAATARRHGAGAVRIVSHPPAEGFYRSQGAVYEGTAPATARIGWTRPILTLRLDGENARRGTA